MKRLFIIFFCCAIGMSAKAQVVGLSEIFPFSGAFDLADYDGDGDIDLAINDYDAEELYFLENDGSNQFSVIFLGATTEDGSVKWLDIDNDGVLEIIDHNNGEPSIFQYDASLGIWEAFDFPGVFESEEFGYNDFTDLKRTDLNNDGFQDLVAQGSYSELLFLGQVDSWSGSLSTSRPAVGDFDGDGYTDIIYTDSFSENNLLLSNTGSGFLVVDLPVGELNLAVNFDALIDTHSSDFNGDGTMDFLALTGNQYELIICKGDGAFGFAIDTISLESSIGPLASQDLIDVGDYDLDGWNDIIVAIDGELNILYNLQDGAFSDPTLIGFGDNVQFVDIDYDGDLDVFSNQEFIENETTQVNSAPTVPTNVQVSANLEVVSVSFDRSTDDLTPSASISYEFFISDADGNFVTGLYEDTNGFRTLYESENPYLNNEFSIRLEDGTYTVYVKSIDNAGLSSTFSAATSATVTGGYVPSESYPIENSFLQELDPSLFLSDEEKDQVAIDRYDQVAGVDALALGSMDFADYDQDGDQDLIISGAYEEDQEIFYETSVYKNDGTGAFEATSVVIRPLRNPLVKWVDLDLDDLVDVVIMGVDTALSTGRPVTRVYKNYGDDIFIEAASLSIGTNRQDFGQDQEWTNNQSIDIDWWDVSSDGDLDLLISGYSSTGVRQTRLYENKGSMQFEQKSFSSSVFAIPTAGGVRWLDADSDGQIDFVHFGLDTDDNMEFSLFRNDGGTFSKELIQQVAWFDSSFYNPKIALADFDNDDDWDVVIATEFDDFDDGSAELSGQQGLIIYENDQGTFTPLGSFQEDFGYTGNNQRSLQVFDYNGDDYPDFMTTAGDLIGIWSASNALDYQFDTLFVFVNDYATFAQTDFDDELELFSMGGNADPLIVTSEIQQKRAFRFDADITATSVQVVGSSVFFDWSAPQDSLFYNLEVRDTEGGLIKSASSLNEFLIGDPRQKLLQSSYQIGNVPDGTYDWKIQKVDYNNNTSSFVVGDQFSISQFESQQSKSYDCSSCEIGPLTMVDFDADNNLEVFGAVFASGRNVQSRIVNYLFDPDDNSYDTLENTSLFGAAFWDYNDDNYPDLIAVSGEVTQDEFTDESNVNSTDIALYINNTNGSVAKDIIIYQANDILDAISLNDLNNDGLFDILFFDSFGLEVLYGQEDGFDDVPTLLISYQSEFDLASYDIIDVNNDGRVDIFLNANPASLYLNDGEGGFVETPFSGFGGNADNAAWMDYDNDGDIDLVLSTGLFVGVTTKFFKNDGAGNFTQDNLNELDPSFGQLIPLDYNNDGLVDLLASDVSTFDFTTPFKLFVNNAGTLLDANLTSLPEDVVSYVVSDFNADEVPDVYAVGISAASLSFGTSATANSNPQAPAGLVTEVIDFDVSLSWSPAQDLETSDKNHRYNVRLTRSEEDGTVEVIEQRLTANQLSRVRETNANFSTKLFVDSLSDGSYSWDVQAIDINGSVSEISTSNTFDIFVGPALSSSVEIDVTCNNSDPIYTALPNVYEYDWEIIGGQISEVISSNSIQVSWEEIGEGAVVVTNRKFPTRKDTLAINVLESPGASFSFGDNLATNTNIPLQDQSGGADIVSWAWEFENGQTSSDQNPVLTVSQPDNEFSVTLTVTNAAGCTDVLSQNLKIGEEKEINISAVVTPNGDGFNDFLTMQYVERYNDVEVSVYNRSGALVYSSKSYQPSTRWSFVNDSGGPLPAGNYLVTVRVPSANLTDKQIVTLKR